MLERAVEYGSLIGLMAPLVGLRVEACRTLSSGVWGGNHYGDVRTTWSDTRFSDGLLGSNLWWRNWEDESVGSKFRARSLRKWIETDVDDDDDNNNNN